MFMNILSTLITLLEFFANDSGILNIFLKNSQNEKFLSEERKENSIQVKIDLEKAKIHSIGNKNKVTFNIKNELIKSYKCYIEMDPAKLKLWFLTQKETFLYIDKKNTKYLDLEFMDD